MPNRCPFEKAIVSMHCGCEYAGRYAVAEHIGVSCRSNLARTNCDTFLQLLRSHSRFALKLTDTSEHLPFGKEMKVMVGGVNGLSRALRGSDATAAVGAHNIHALVVAAQAAYGSLTTFPYQEIVKSVTAFKTRTRSSPV